jgi:hypothetical protein
MKEDIGKIIQDKKSFVRKLDDMKMDERIEYFYDNPNIEKQYNQYKKDIDIFKTPMHRAETGKSIEEKLFH